MPTNRQCEVGQLGGDVAVAVRVHDLFAGADPQQDPRVRHLDGEERQEVRAHDGPPAGPPRNGASGTVQDPEA